jgi:ornithine carrier protein
MQVPAAASPVKRPLSLIASIYRHHGLLGFWRGQLGTLIRETGGSAAWFGSYEGVSAAFRHYLPRESISSKDLPDAPSKSNILPFYQQMISGACAGVAYNFIFYPADTIKSRMQTEEVVALSRGQSKTSFLAVGKAVWRLQGIKGLYRGCGITVFRAAPSSAFIFSIYESLRGWADRFS